MWKIGSVVATEMRRGEGVGEALAEVMRNYGSSLWFTLNGSHALTQHIAEYIRSIISAIQVNDALKYVYLFWKIIIQVVVTLN